MSSVLTSIKSLLGVDSENTAFDAELILHINSGLSKVKDLGAGKDGVRLYIESSDDEWATYFDEDEILQMIITLVWLEVKLMFDPPGTSFLVTSIENQIKEQKWRITSKVEEGASDE